LADGGATTGWAAGTAGEALDGDGDGIAGVARGAAEAMSVAGGSAITGMPLRGDRLRAT
jgi:hypothetical protein